MKRSLVMLAMAMGAATHGLLVGAEPEQPGERDVVASVCCGLTELSFILESGDPFGGIGNPPRIDLRFSLETLGSVQTIVTQGITQPRSRFLILPLGRVDGRSLGVVLATEVIDAMGRPFGGEE